MLQIAAFRPFFMYVQTEHSPSENCDMRIVGTSCQWNSAAVKDCFDREVLPAEFFGEQLHRFGASVIRRTSTLRRELSLLRRTTT